MSATIENTENTAPPVAEIPAEVEVPKEETETEKALNAINSKMLKISKRLNTTEGQILELK